MYSKGITTGYSEGVLTSRKGIWTQSHCGWLMSQLWWKVQVLWHQDISQTHTGYIVDWWSCEFQLPKLANGVASYHWHLVTIVYYRILKELPLATVKVAVLSSPGFNPQTTELGPERQPSTCNILTTLLPWPSRLTKN